MIEAIQAEDARAVLERVSQLATQGYDLSAFCNELTRYVRNLMIARSCGAQTPLLQTSDDDRVDLGRLSAGFSEEDLARFFQVLLRAQNEMRYSLEPRFQLELALVKLVHARKLVPIENLLSGIQSQTPGASPRKGSTATSAAIPGGQPVAPPLSRAEAPAAPAIRPADGPSQFNRAAQKFAESPEARAPIATPGGPSVAVPFRPAIGPSAATPGGRAVAPAFNPAGNEQQELPPSPEDASLAAIKAALFEESKFLSSCLNPLAGWRFENGQVHLMYSKQASWAAELLQSRAHQEKLRAACEKVLGQPVKIYVTLNAESGRPLPTPAASSARERALRDPAVEAFQKRFDCAILDVKDLSRE